MKISNNFSSDVKNFIEQNELLCIATLGLAIFVYCIGNLGARAVAWIKECAGSAKKTDEVAPKIIKESQTNSEQPKIAQIKKTVRHFNFDKVNDDKEKPKETAKEKPSEKPKPLVNKEKLSENPKAQKSANHELAQTTTGQNASKLAFKLNLAEKLAGGPPKPKSAVNEAAASKSKELDHAVLDRAVIKKSRKPQTKKGFNNPFKNDNAKNANSSVAVPATAVSATKKPRDNMGLWLDLASRTALAMKNVTFVSSKEVSHRFPDVICPRETAVNYGLHANRVGEGLTSYKFIATQAPLPNQISAFWNAAVFENCTIIDLTNLRDHTQGGIVEKYYPLNGSKQCGNVTVALKEIQNSKFFVYEVQLGSLSKKTDITRLSYSQWPDFGAISLDDLTNLVNTMSQMETKNFLVHCRAGVGRTGTLITACILKEQVEAGKITKDNLDEELLNLILEMRKQRGPMFVQSHEQLGLLRQYGLSLLN